MGCRAASIAVVPPAENVITATVVAYNIAVNQPVQRTVQVNQTVVTISVVSATNKIIQVNTCPQPVGLLPRIRQPLIGTIDGANTVFSTAELFCHEAYIRESVYLRGLFRAEGTGCDYVASESGGAGAGYDTITFTRPPKPGDILSITYYLA